MNLSEPPQAFKIMDADGGGTIDKQELSGCLEKLGEMIGAITVGGSL